MSKSTSAEIIIGLKKSLIWQTAVECGANNGLKVKGGFSIDRGVEDVEDDSIGTSFIQDSDNTQISASTTLPMFARYAGLDLLLEQSMGGATVPSYQSTLLHSGTSNAANSDTTHIEYLGGGFGTASELDGTWVVLRTGTAAYEVTQVVSHTDTILTVGTITDPAGDTTFEVSYYAPADIGQADASGAATLIDATKSWGVDAYAGLWVKNITTDEVREITSNTSDTLTVDDDWAVPPTGTDLYEIFGGVASHVYSLTADNVAKMCTLAINNGNNVDEGTSLKFGGFTMSGTVGQAIDIEFPAMINDRVVDSVVNTSGTMANVTVRETANRLLYNHLVVRMNNKTAGALSSGDKIYPNAFSINANQPKRGIYGTASAGFEQHDEPQSDVIFKSELTLGFESYESATNFTKWAADTRQKLDFVFTGKLIQDAVYRSFTIEAPHAKFTKAELTYDQGIFKHPVTMKLHATDTAPTGMSGITNPFQVTVVNDYGGYTPQAGNP